MLCVNNNVLKKDANVYHRMSQLIDRNKIKNLVLLDSRPTKAINVAIHEPSENQTNQVLDDIHEFTLLYPSSTNNRRIAQLIQNDLRNQFEVKLKGG